MNNQDAQERINFLVSHLNYHNYIYYQKDNREISDFDFDQLLDELQSLEKSYPEFLKANSPTQRVGGAITKSFRTITHQRPMLSLGNTYSKEE